MHYAPRTRLAPGAHDLLADRSTCTLTTIRPNGTPHVAPVRFTWDDAAGLARVMTVAGRAKVRNLLDSRHPRAVVCQVSGPRWISFEGSAVVSDDPTRIADGVHRYTLRYGTPPPRPPGLVVIEIAVDQVLGIF